jgi:hypothetical protein
MGQQEETIKIVQPLRELLQYHGWHVTKTHGNQFQKGLPDLFICHPKYKFRWVECKVKGRPFTDAQKKLFPIWIQNGVGIWLIQGTDFRSREGKAELHRAYDKLFREPNCAYAFYNRELL